MQNELLPVPLRGSVWLLGFVDALPLLVGSVAALGFELMPEIGESGDEFVAEFGLLDSFWDRTRVSDPGLSWLPTRCPRPLPVGSAYGRASGGYATA